MHRNDYPRAAAVLAASAAALLGAEALAEAAPEKSFIGFRVSQYSEDALPQDRVVDGGETARYDIDVQHVNFVTPVGGRFSFSADVIRETLTGASPVGSVKVAEDDVRVAMSGASITEERQDVTLGAAWYADSGVLRLSAGQSVENDYDARYASLGFDYSFNDNNSTLGFSVSASDDVVTPTDAALFGRIERGAKESRSAFVGFTQVVSKKLIVQTGVGVNRLEGYLSDPYKAGHRDHPLDRRPDSRLQRTWTVGTRYFIDSIESAFKFDYRYFVDDWGIDSHTVQAGLARRFGEKLLLDGGLRFYMQDEADFYEPYQVPALQPQPEHFSMDFRLSPYGAVSLNASARYEFTEAWTMVFVIERYQSGAEYTVTDVVIENPGLVDFTRGSFGVEYRF